MVVAAPVLPGTALPRPRPLAQRADAHQQDDHDDDEDDELLLGRRGDVPLEELEEHAHADAGDEGHRQVDHGADERRRERVQQQVGLRAWVSALVWFGALRMAVKAESAPATVHVSVEVRRIHTPERRAESAFSDMARMARPHEVKRTASTRITVTMGATMRVSTSVGVNDEGAEGERQVEGDRHRLVEVGGPDEGQRGESQQHLAQADGGHHHQDAGAG
jgi:hypothetical protein